MVASFFNFSGWQPTHRQIYQQEKQIVTRIKRNFVELKGGESIFFWGFLAIAIAFRPLVVWAQIERATVREILNGDRVFIDETPAEINDIATFRQEVSTKESLVGLEFNNGAAGRLASYSTAIVGQCVEVQQGLLLVSGPANGCTATFEIGVEGTFYLLEVSDRGESQIKVLNGAINLLSSDSLQPIILREGEKLAIDPAGILGRISLLSQEEVEEILQDSLFQDFESELPGMKKLQGSLERLYPGIVLPSLPGFKLLLPPPPPPSPLPILSLPISSPSPPSIRGLW